MTACRAFRFFCNFLKIVFRVEMALCKFAWKADQSKPMIWGYRNHMSVFGQPSLCWLDVTQNVHYFQNFHFYKK